jgi:hypothetical protein
LGTVWARWRPRVSSAATAVGLPAGAAVSVVCTRRDLVPAWRRDRLFEDVRVVAGAVGFAIAIEDALGELVLGFLKLLGGRDRACAANDPASGWAATDALDCEAVGHQTGASEPCVGFGCERRDETHRDESCRNSGHSPDTPSGSAEAAAAVKGRRPDPERSEWVDSRLPAELGGLP